MYLCMCVCMYADILFVCMYVCLHLFMYVYMYACMCVCMHVCWSIFFDSFSKYVECYPVPDSRASTIAKVLYDKIVCRWGVPRTLYSDRGPNYLSDLQTGMLKLMGTKQLLTTAYSANSNGLAERAIKTLITMLRMRLLEHGGDWCENLSTVLYACRATPNT